MIAALELGRNFVGYEVNKGFKEVIEKKVKENIENIEF